jgi:hypothetical protein
MTAPPFPPEPELTRPAMRPRSAPLDQAVRGSRVLPADVHTTLLAVDITGFGDPSRDTGAHLRLRAMLYDHLIEAFTITGLPWWECHREDRGDGAFIVAPADTEPGYFLDPLAHQLSAILLRENRLVSHVIRIQLRMAVHYGRVHYDAHGVAGRAATHLFRLLEATEFKRAARAARAAGVDLAMIVSDPLYADVAQRGGLLNPAAYRRIHISNKETRRAPAWLWLRPGPFGWRR